MDPVKTAIVLATASLFLIGPSARADWTETNKDGVPGGGLDYLDYWVAVYNGTDPGPTTTWDTAANLATWFGTDPGWTGNVVHIADNDATAYAAANKVESFTNVRVTAAVSTIDIDEEFGIIARASTFDFDDEITDVSAYAATFSANNAQNPGDPMQFNLYKIVNGVIDESWTANPEVPNDFDDLITWIELSVCDTVNGPRVDARLFDDADSSSPLATLSMTDDSANPFTQGYTGVINLDTASPDGIGSYYDTLSSITIPEPGSLTLLAATVILMSRRRRA